MKPALRFRPTLETLEHRACPAFFAGLSHGNLLVTATEAVSLFIDQLDADSFAVYENNSGTVAVIDSVTKDLNIKLSDHDDYVEMLLWGHTAPGDIRINFGDGNNSLNLGGFGGTIAGALVLHAGSGNDQFLVGDAYDTQVLRVLGTTHIHTGSGDDIVQIGATGQVQFLESAHVHLGCGDDVLYIFASFFTPAKAHGGDGTDVIIGSHPTLTAHGFE